MLDKYFDYSLHAAFLGQICSGGKMLQITGSHSDGVDLTVPDMIE